MRDNDTTRRIGGAAVLAVALGVLLAFVIWAAGGCAALGLPKSPTPLQRVEAIESDYLDVYDAISLLNAAGFVSDSDWRKVEAIDAAVQAGIASIRRDLDGGKRVDVAALRKAVRAAVFELLPYVRAAERARDAQVDARA